MTFTRQDAHKKKRLGSKWRKPKGIDSKMRLQLKGYAKKVKPGFGSANKHLVNGKAVVQVATLADLAQVGKEQVGLVSGTLGMKSKIALLKAAAEKNITLLNGNKDMLEALEKAFADRKKTKKAEEEKKKAAEKKKQEEKKKDEQPKAEDKPAEKKEDDKKVQEKKEKDKVLTKKNAI